MPIKPIESPYRVVGFNKARRTRRAQPRDPEEKEKYRRDDESAIVDFDDSPEEKKEELIPEEIKTKDETKTESPDSEDEKPKLDIRI